MMEYSRYCLGELYLGGYKSAVNLDFLQSANIRLVVSTAKGLDTVLGPKYKKEVPSNCVISVLGLILTTVPQFT